MTDQHTQLVRWLNDTHMMERSIEEVLRKHLTDFADFPEWEARVREHAGQTAEQARRIEGCIIAMGGQTSAARSAFADLMGRMQGMSTAMFRDVQVKNALAEYATEHLEIASYETVITAAEQVGEHEVARVCREILAEEEEMAEWLRARLPDLTSRFMQQPAGL